MQLWMPGNSQLYSFVAAPRLDYFPASNVNGGPAQELGDSFTKGIMCRSLCCGRCLPTANCSGCVFRRNRTRLTTKKNDKLLPIVKGCRNTHRRGTVPFRPSPVRSDFYLLIAVSHVEVTATSNRNLPGEIKLLRCRGFPSFCLELFFEHFLWLFFPGVLSHPWASFVLLLPPRR